MSACNMLKQCRLVDPESVNVSSWKTPLAERTLRQIHRFAANTVSDDELDLLLLECTSV